MDQKKEGPGAASAEARNATGLDGDVSQPTVPVQGSAPIPVGGKPVVGAISTTSITDKPDKDEAERFLCALDPDATFFTFQTFDDNNERKKARRDTNKAHTGKDPFGHTIEGSLDRCWDRLVRLNEQGAGVFVTVAETNGKGRRKEENIICIRALFVDLDGSPLGPVQEWQHAPHIVAESSPGHWHAYWLVADAERGQFRSLQKALAKKFDADPSVHDLPRVMRLPGFVHRKGEPFLSHLVSAAERPPYTVAELFPDGVPASEPPPSEPHSNDDDSYWSELNSEALQNLGAWVPALFPEAEKSNQGWRVSSKSLGRDLQEDLSLTPQGIKDFGIHDLGDAREGRRSPIDVVIEHGGMGFSAAANWLQERLPSAQAVAEKEANGTRLWREFLAAYPAKKAKVAGKQSKSANGTVRAAKKAGNVSLEDFQAYMPAHSYIFMPTREPWPASSVNSRLGRIPLVSASGRPVVNSEGEQKTISASLWLDRHRPVEQMTWAPGMPVLIRDRLVAEGGWFDRPRATCLNLYRPPTIVLGNAAEADPWLAHIDAVYGRGDDADQITGHIINYFAQRVQRPEEKINHALLLGGPQGIGKDTMLEPVKRAVGPWNFSEVSPITMLGRFNGFLKSVILRVSEARDLGDVNRYQFYDHMKAYTAAPPDVLRVDEKNLREHSVLNCCGVIITTNHKTDGIYLPPDDRRHFVAWSNITKESFAEDYWKKLWDWYNNGGDRHVAAFLAGRDLRDFDAKAPPPKTQAFWEIVNANRAPEDAELADIIDQLNNPDALTIAAIQGEAAGSDLFEWIKDRRNRRAIPHRLEACGYVQISNTTRDDGLWIVRGRRQAIYAKAGLSLNAQFQAARALIKATG